MRLSPNRRGILLLASVMLLVFVSIVVVGTTVFIAQRLRQVNASRIRAACINLAQAGINQAVYLFRLRDLSGNGYFSLGQTNIDANNFFILTATGANLLMVNTSTAAFGTGRASRDLLNLRIQNATNSQPITINRMTVSWSKSGPARNLRRIRIDGIIVWRGTAASGETINLDPIFPLSNTLPILIYPINFLRFSGSMDGTTNVTIQFFMTDGSSKTVTVFPASPSNNFTVTSLGRTVGSNIVRTVRAEYNATTSRVINYLEQ